MDSIVFAKNVLCYLCCIYLYGHVLKLQSSLQSWPPQEKVLQDFCGTCSGRPFAWIFLIPRLHLFLLYVALVLRLASLYIFTCVYWKKKSKRIKIFLEHPLKLAYIIARVKNRFSLKKVALGDCCVFSVAQLFFSCWTTCSSADVGQRPSG